MKTIPKAEVTGLTKAQNPIQIVVLIAVSIITVWTLYRQLVDCLAANRLKVPKKGTQKWKTDSTNYLIRSKGEPEQSDSEGFRYVKTYGARSLVWTYSAERAKHFSYAEACKVYLLLKEARTDSEIVPASTEASHATPDPGKQVTEVTIRSFTDDDSHSHRGSSARP